jgi:2-dehydropantoate 2-reductase
MHQPSTLSHDQSPFSILILGLGAVGGYYGGKLAAHYEGSPDHRIIFFARGANKTAIESGGLRVITPAGEFFAHPSLVTDRPESIGKVDLILCCLKSYDLEEGVRAVAPCIQSGTIILPLLNGIDARERTQGLFPEANVWEGCVYIIASKVAPGSVEETGTFNRLLFGLPDGRMEGPGRVQTIFRNAGIRAAASTQILRDVWEKFLFISPFATLTSYLDGTIATIRNDPENKRVLWSLIEELKKITDAKGLGFTDSMVQTTFDKLMALPDAATSSMENDFKKGGRTELHALTVRVTEIGRQTGIPTPQYDRMLASLQQRTQKALS